MIVLKIRAIAFYSIVVCSIVSCKEYYRNKSHAGTSQASIEQGELLAKKHCQSCHAFPDPSLLDAQTWEKGVLPVMGPMLGIFHHEFERYPSGRNDKYLDSNFYPSRPVIGSAEWQHILDYYTATSPDSLHRPKHEPVKSGLPFFEIAWPETGLPGPATTFLKIVPSDSGQSLFLADLQAKTIYAYDSRLQITDSLGEAGSVSDIHAENGGFLVCDIGQINPNNGRFGMAYHASRNSGGKMKKDSTPLLSQLARPVQVLSADLDNDGRLDYIACEFGFLTGGLTWFRNLGDGSLQRQVLSTLPGASKVYIQDYNSDGLPDLWVLFGQGEEGIFLFTNKGGGKYRQQQVLRFSPVNGSTYFELADFNGDGHTDILYTCGDNADYSRVLKPYHGIYVFLNDGQNEFSQEYFFPMDGCFKALARDFDKDGDLDIAAISFFADYAREPDRGFLYLENQGKFRFQPYTFPESRMGRWLTMDAGDFDGDGNMDLVLGNFSRGPTFIEPLADWKKGPAFVFLRNRLGSRE